MNKYIILTLILCCFVVSCGKKGNPTYQSSNNIKIHNIS